MRLFLVRHGEAVDERINPDRPLTDQGIKEVKAVAHFLNNARIRLNVIYHSTKTRAKQTAQIIKQILNSLAPLKVREDLAPNAAMDNILEDIAQLQGNVMIVGHLPFLGYLISRLVVADAYKTIVAMPTGTVVILEKNNDRGWHFVGIVTPEFL